MRKGLAMSMAAILLTLASAQTGVGPSGEPVKRQLAVSASASVRIIRPAIVAFDRRPPLQGDVGAFIPPQRRVERDKAKAKASSATVWIEFS